MTTAASTPTTARASWKRRSRCAYVGGGAGQVPIALHAERDDGAGAVTLTPPGPGAFTVLLPTTTAASTSVAKPELPGARTADGIVGWVLLPSHPDGSTDAEGL